MANKITHLCLMLTLAISGMASAQVDANEGQQAIQPSNGKFLQAALISGISSAVAGGVGGGVANIIGSLFNKLSSSLFGGTTTMNQPQTGDLQQSVTAAPIAFQQQFQPMSEQLVSPSLQVNNAVATAPAGSITPAIAYKIEQLDSKTFLPIRIFEDLKKNTPSLKSGDVFSITYEPNMPGQVRLENVNAQNEMTSLGTYNVVGRQPLRLPKTKGFQLSGAPGIEQINIYFTPCRPPEAQNKTGVVEFGGLPLCSNSQTTNLAKAGKGGSIKPKTVVNMDSPDLNIAVGIATDYTQEDLQNGMPVMQEIKLVHQPGASPL